ncbi:MAG: phage BR0599 family protein, partial [Pseudomonadota bacterium]
IDVDGAWLTFDRLLSPTTPVGIALELLEGCDHTLGTCASRFNNAVNFRGEPFLPGNDLLARYGRPSE